MISIDGLSNERIVLDGDWFEKLRGGRSTTRLPATSFRGAQWKDLERRTRLFGGERERLVQLTLSFEGGPFVGFTTSEAKRADVELLVAQLDAASS